MKRLSSEPKRTICSNPDSPFRFFAWPSIARLKDGTLLMGASGFRMKHVCPFGKAVLCYSFNEGQVWTPPAVVIDTLLDDRDCGVVPFGDHRVFVSSFNNTTKAQRGWNSIPPGSDENAVRRRDLIEAYLRFVDNTDAEARFLGSTYRISDDGGYTFGPIGRVPVTTPHGPCAMPDGTLIYIGRRFSKDDSFDDTQKPYLQCWRMTDSGEWEYLSDIENIIENGAALLSCEPHAICLQNGTIIMHIRAQNLSDSEKLFTIYQSESHDGGRSFTKPRRILPPLGGAPAHLLMHSSGRLISAYGHREPPYGIRVMFSDDMGETWDTDWILDDTAALSDVGYPATVEIKDGRLLTVFYERLESGEAVIRQQIWSLP